MKRNRSNKDYTIYTHVKLHVCIRICKTDRLSRLRVSEERFFEEKKRNLYIDMVNLGMTDSEIGHTSTETAMCFHLLLQIQSSPKLQEQGFIAITGEASENGVVRVSYSMA